MPRTILALIIVYILPLAQLTAGAPQINIDDTVIQMPLAEDVTLDDAVDSMKLRANDLNFKLVAYLPLYKELESMGVKTGRIEIFQFCDARIAKEMIDFNINFSAYLPCRITLLEDKDGKGKLITMNLGMFIESAKLSPELHKKALKVKNNIESIMNAGANGEL